MRWLQEIDACRYGSKIKFRIVLLFLLLPLLVSWGRPVATLSAASLTRSADYIFTGDVVEVHLIGEDTVEEGGKKYPVTRMIAVVRVGDVLKGTIPDRVIQVQFIQYLSDNGSGPITDRLTAPSYRLLFLNRSSKDFVFANREHGSLPVSRDVADVPVMTDSETYSKVVACLARGDHARRIQTRTGTPAFNTGKSSPNQEKFRILSKTSAIFGLISQPWLTNTLKLNLRIDTHTSTANELLTSRNAHTNSEGHDTASAVR